MNYWGEAGSATVVTSEMLVAVILLGFLITFPDCLFSYTRLSQAAVASSHSSIDAYLKDSRQVNLVDYASAQPAIVSLLSPAAIPGARVLHGSRVLRLFAGMTLMLWIIFCCKPSSTSLS